MAAGASVNDRSVDRSTPLLSACSRGFAHIASKLLQHGANAEAKLHEDDALRSALKFFKACRVYNSCSRSASIYTCWLQTSSHVMSCHIV